jgi:hypothetical protein
MEEGQAKKHENEKEDAEFENMASAAKMKKKKS